MTTLKQKMLVVMAGLVLVLGAALCFGLSIASASGVTITLTPLGGTNITMGSAYSWTAAIKNNSGSTMTLSNMVTLMDPSGTMIMPLQYVGKSVANGTTYSTSRDLTSAYFMPMAGTWTLMDDAVDSTGTMQASGMATFTVNALPSSIIPIRFNDIATNAGVAVSHHLNTTDCQDTSGMGFEVGAGWADYNNDGYPDLFVTDYAGTSHLFKNNGNLTFTDVTAAAGLPTTITNASGVTWADYDNDGFPDLLVMTVGSPKLFHNNGNGTFTDVSTASGLDNASGRGTSAAWADYDNDGWLDVYTVYYGTCAPGGFQHQQSHLYHNNHNGTFTDVSTILGPTNSTQLTGQGFAAIWFDYDNSGHPSLYVANDFDMKYQANIMWHNNGNGTFTNTTSTTNTALNIASMGIGVGDFNRDGQLDIISSAIGANHILQSNVKNTGKFNDTRVKSGFSRDSVNPMMMGTGGMTMMSSTTWGMAFADFNNDGYEDAFMAGGDMMNTMMPMTQNAVMTNNINGHLTGNTTDSTWLDLSYASGAAMPTISRLVAVADFDADGFQDVLVENYDNSMMTTSMPLNLYRNEGPADGNTNNWLEVRLVGVTSNRDGVGAKVNFVAGGATQYRQIICGSSIGAGSGMPAHFGLGTSTTGTLTITWPSGTVQTFSSVSSNQRLVVTEGSSTLGHDPVPTRIPE